MEWKRVLNAGLTNATGYKFVSAKRVPGDRSSHSVRPRNRANSRHHDDVARQIMQSVKPRTMTSSEKLFALILATRHVVDHRIAGAIVECGVWRGGSMQAVARTLLACGITDRDLHLFDTFEGMPAPTEKDRRHDGRLASQILARDPRSGPYWAVASLDDVRAGMDETGYPADRVHFHPGLVEHTIPARAPDCISILRLDTDWYESTRHELEHLYDRMPSGGILILDDYAFWQGARQAVDEFLAQTRARLLLLPMATGRIAVKP